MDNPSVLTKKTIVYDKNHEQGVFVLCVKADNEAVLKRFHDAGFAFLGSSDLPHKSADLFGQVLMTPDREEHFLCLTPLAGNASAVLGGGQNVLAFSMPISQYKEMEPLFQRLVDLSTRFFTAENRDAHAVVDEAEAVLAQFR